MAGLSMPITFPVRFRASPDATDYPLDLSRSFGKPPLAYAIRGADGIPAWTTAASVPGRIWASS